MVPGHGIRHADEGTDNKSTVYIAPWALASDRMIPDTRRHRPTASGRPLRAGIGVCLVSATLTLFGCTTQSGLSPPNMILDAQMEAVPLYPPASEAVPRPEGTVASRPVSRDGSYAGRAVVLVTNGGLCTRSPTISDFVVRGDSVRFGQFQGTIDPDDRLQMAYGRDWVVGQFQGALFRGQLSVSGPRQDPGCTYFVGLSRTGS